LTDFENGEPFTLPAAYMLQQQFYTEDHFSGDGLNGMAPIAFVATSGSSIYVVFRGLRPQVVRLLRHAVRTDQQSDAVQSDGPGYRQLQLLLMAAPVYLAALRRACCRRMLQSRPVCDVAPSPLHVGHY
jgi:hypothetical protein